MCICQEGEYFTGYLCISTSPLKPSRVSVDAQTSNGIYLSWTSLTVINYTNSYETIYTAQGGPQQTYNVVGQPTATLVPNLTPGTTYAFVTWSDPLQDMDAHRLYQHHLQYWLRQHQSAVLISCVSKTNVSVLMDNNMLKEAVLQFQTSDHPSLPHSQHQPPLSQSTGTLLQLLATPTPM